MQGPFPNLGDKQSVSRDTPHLGPAQQTKLVLHQAQQEGKKWSGSLPEETLGTQGLFGTGLGTAFGQNTVSSSLSPTLSDTLTM